MQEKGWNKDMILESECYYVYFNSYEWWYTYVGGCGGFIQVFLLCCGIYEMCLYYVLTILPSVLSIFDV